MKFRIERQVLAEAVSRTARIIPLRPAAPVLGGIKIEADTQGTITFSGFDYEVSARENVTAEVEEPGVVLVQGKLLAEITRALNNAPVDVALDGTTLQITCHNAHFSLQTFPAEEYPTLPEPPAIIGRIDAEEFGKAVAQVATAASTDETVPLLTGIRMEIEGEKITLMSTDRYRLALRELTWNPEDPSISAVALVKSKTLVDVAKTLGGQEGTIEMGLSTGSGLELIGFSSGGRQTTSQLLSGDYPPVRKLFPESSPIHASVMVHNLLDSVKRVALVTQGSSPIRLSFTQGGVTLNAGNGDDAQASESLHAYLNGEDISVAFNPKYLMDGLSSLSHEAVRLSFTHPTKPVEFTSQDSLEADDYTEFRYLLVPIRFAD
ncbi:MAG: DNA polymerase III subunit beta [Cellulomonadaceae bacterium]|nr:DNA polymerase III subunit beta [Cellulomonadaceae bacterium]